MRLTRGEKVRADCFDQNAYCGKFITPPRWLIYSGVSSWATFQMKYERFARDPSFNAQQAKVYLSCVLAGRAADYYFWLKHLDTHFEYLQKWLMEQRFVPQRQRKTTFLSFQNVRQKHVESLWDWADQVHHLALGAFEMVANAELRERDIELMLFKFYNG
ncbi:slain motif-containing protein 2 [Plakobranchus ocellatus]|uniref:Slain motif-containing protein 2 n=1 Tax=Plakobranchus ocellatus TaxID=259542 RepID=A0AAV4BI09_9GAST|nr:slain motif-containing protein 2 [Plakobranchus ocellatus]